MPHSASLLLLIQGGCCALAERERAILPQRSALFIVLAAALQIRFPQALHRPRACSHRPTARIHVQAPQASPATSEAAAAGVRTDTASEPVDWVHLARLVAHFDSLDVCWTGEVPFEDFIARCVSLLLFMRPFVTLAAPLVRHQDSLPMVDSGLHRSPARACRHSCWMT